MYKRQSQPSASRSSVAARQVAPIAAGAADATVATPYAWRWEDDAGRARTMTWGGLAGVALHRLDGDLGRGTELLDEAMQEGRHLWRRWKLISGELRINKAELGVDE